MPGKLIRITTVPLSLHKLLSNQLKYISSHYEVVAVSSGGKYLDLVGKDQGVRTKAVDMTRKITPFKDLAALISLCRFLKAEKPLIVHTHTPKAGLLGMIAARIAGVPIRLHTVAGLPLLEAQGPKRRLLEWTEKLTYSCAMHVYPNSYRMKDIMVKNRYCPEFKLKVIGNGSSNGIDTAYFSPEHFSAEQLRSLREKYGLSENDIVLCFVGRMVKDKGIHELIQAFLKLAPQYPALKLLLTGPFEPDLSPVQPEVENAIRNDRNIVWVDYQEDVRPFLAMSNIFVFPSYREGFPNVVMQAGAMGLPSIVTDINGCNEIIEEGKNGMIIPPKDESKLREAIELLIRDEKRRKDMASVSRKMIIDRYDQHLLWSTLLAEYRVLENKYLK
ncbi:glycosyltransferase family 4 protein [Chitinophaga tropicalis]|uniref:Glycosyltransferase n=1 Tax=Chitinophaga tropicalis TaxID=2683588 RepID=A0A7K1U3E9_9BACT|nr:glycosyltransferase family 4 protein [Chitinophaga tropicalis]MVT08883.1 glycosyltransferase [Chitinophaga tropicalis]